MMMNQKKTMNQKKMIFYAVTCEDPVNFIHSIDYAEESLDEEDCVFKIPPAFARSAIAKKMFS